MLSVEPLDVFVADHLGTPYERSLRAYCFAPHVSLVLTLRHIHNNNYSIYSALFTLL